MTDTLLWRPVSVLQDSTTLVSFFAIGFETSAWQVEVVANSSCLGPPPQSLTSESAGAILDF